MTTAAIRHEADREHHRQQATLATRSAANPASPIRWTTDAPYAAASTSRLRNRAKARSGSSRSVGTCHIPARRSPLTAPISSRTNSGEATGPPPRVGRVRVAVSIAARRAAGGSSASSSACVAAYGCGWMRRARPGRRGGVVGADESSPQMASPPRREVDRPASRHERRTQHSFNIEPTIRRAFALPGTRASGHSSELRSSGTSTAYRCSTAKSITSKARALVEGTTGGAAPAS